MIKSLLKKLGFYNKERIETNSQIPNSNSIVFWVGEDGLPYVKVYIVDTDIESSKHFGDMLFSINTGQYMNYTLSVLVDISRQDAHVNTYIKNVISYWQSLLLTKDTSDDPENNDPHIKPTAFNNIVRHNDRT